MAKEVITSSNAPAAIGPYSQAVKVNGFLYISGQLGLDPSTGKFPSDDVEAQCRQSFANIKAILAEAGMSTDDVVKVNILLADIADFGKVNAIYADVFTAPYPARAAYAVKALPAGGLVEIEVVAYKG